MTESHTRHNNQKIVDCQQSHLISTTPSSRPYPACFENTSTDPLHVRKRRKLNSGLDLHGISAECGLFDPQCFTGGPPTFTITDLDNTRGYSLNTDIDLQSNQFQRAQIKVHEIPTVDGTDSTWSWRQSSSHQEDLFSAGAGPNPNEEAIDEQIVCYGALKNFAYISLEIGKGYTGEIQWNGGSNLVLDSGQSALLEDSSARTLTSLSEVGATLEFFLSKSDAAAACVVTGRQKRRFALSKFAIDVVIYGYRDVAEDLGRWLGSITLYLETPSQCSMNVPYCNPHRLSDEEAPLVMTDQLNSSTTALHQAVTDDSWQPPTLYTTRSYLQARQPSLLKSELHPHQRQALTFMQNRESGWDVHNERSSNDLWQYRSDSFGRQKYVESFSGISSFKPPTDFRGGILADEMGLGKTCTMLAVIAADIEAIRSLTWLKNGEMAPTTSSTLIIVPLPLLQVWEKQMKEHFQPRSISWTTYYGAGDDAHHRFDQYDIVLTTYGKVSQERRNAKSKPAASRPISDIHWRRIVLDEAHVIKNRHTDVTKAVTGLRADRRWCITGTPIQNRSSELFPLLQFLKVHPYDDFKMFEQIFVQPWKNAESTALLKLQEMMSTLAIRRPRAMIRLPEKEEIVIPVSFDAEERSVYDRARKGVVDVINAAFDSNARLGGSYLNALQRINDLRYICNHGVPSEKKTDLLSIRENVDDASIGRELDLLFGADDAVICHACSQPMSQQADHNYLSPPIARGIHQRPRFTCPCSSSSSRSTPFDDSTTSPSPSSSMETSHSPAQGPTTQHISSKVRSLVSQIEQTPHNERCAVFSFRITTLALISHALTLKSITHLRYDGTMPRHKRDAVLASFSDPNSQIKVILVSISCGGQGLDLTAANHAYLVEPQWNPMLEEQAMSRVYRLGQCRPVKLCRFVVQETWEERIVDLQRRKRRLAELIVDQKGLESDGAKRLLASLKDLV